MSGPEDAAIVPRSATSSRGGASSPLARAKLEIERLAEELARHGAADRPLALVLGSGLGALADALEERRVIPGAELASLPRAGVAGHAGSIVLGRLDGVPCLLQSGRVHFYEGWSPLAVTRAVRAFARLGTRVLLLTNAAGGLVPGWPAGTLVRLTDHLDLQGRGPLFPGEGARANPYDAALGAVLDRVAGREGLALERGIYAALPGPSYETAAEIRALRALGAQLVGMSTAAEASAGCASGMRVAALSCVANPAAGITGERLDHGDVLASTGRAAGRLGRLVTRAARELVTT